MILLPLVQVLLHVAQETFESGRLVLVQRRADPRQRVHHTEDVEVTQQLEESPWKRRHLNGSTHVLGGRLIQETEEELGNRVERQHIRVSQIGEEGDDSNHDVVVVRLQPLVQVAHQTRDDLKSPVSTRFFSFGYKPRRRIDSVSRSEDRTASRRR